MSLSGVFILLYKLRRKRKELKIIDVFVYSAEREDVVLNTAVTIQCK